MYDYHYRIIVQVLMNKRNYNIDILKAIAIISVIALHSLSIELLLSTGALFHIWQSVPIFLILAGYNTANSYNKEYFSLNQFYTVSVLSKKIKRLLYPYITIWILQSIAIYIFQSDLSFKKLLFSFISGGWGPGSYFIPIIVQATLILPIIYYFGRKNLTAMIIIMFILSLFIEIVCLAFDISSGVYRLLIFRYLFALTLGVWLALNSIKINWKHLITLSVISLIYMTGVTYFNWVFIIEKYWLSQHAPSYFYPLLLVVLGLRIYEVSASNRLSRNFISIGQASYHIFLVQMVYFWGLESKVPSLPIIVNMMINITTCIVLGLLFFKIDNELRRISKGKILN